MQFLTISGSARQDSSNVRLLEHFPDLFPDDSFQYYPINELPLFQADEDKAPWPKSVLAWRLAIKESTALIICTPEYIYNVPAVIKNALEWLASSGELMAKPVLPITFTPNPPRGEKAMQSLLWSLQALDARIVGQLALYQTEIKSENDQLIIEGESLELLQAGIELF